MVHLTPEELNELFETLQDWEHQIQALERQHPIEWEMPTP